MFPFSVASVFTSKTNYKLSFIFVLVLDESLQEYLQAHIVLSQKHIHYYYKQTKPPFFVPYKHKHCRLPTNKLKVASVSDTNMHTSASGHECNDNNAHVDCLLL